MKTGAILSIILLLSFFLNTLGITWGLPDRWNVDESVANVLKMAYNRQIMPEKDVTHPTFYYFFLIVFLAFYFLLLKFTGYPLYLAASSASVSWINFANTDPFLASSLYIIARTLSAILGVATVFVVYLIAKKIYSKRVGLFSALILALSAGFIEDSHYAKSSILVNFLSVLTVYFCIKAVWDGKFRKNFLIASFLAGLSLATKFNGGILILPLIATYLYNNPYSYNSGVSYVKYIKELICSKIVISSMGLYLFGFAIGFPSIFLHAARYLSGFNYSYKENYFIGNLSFGQRVVDLLTCSIAYSFKIINIYGIFLSFIVFAGLIITIRNRNRGKTIILSLIIPYFLIISSIQIIEQPVAKYVILLIPFLSIFGGLFVNKLTESKRIPNGLKYLFFLFILLFSLRHIAYTEKIFLKNDIRYITTEWIDKNIPYGASIEIFSELDWYFSSRLLRKYNVLFFGTDSKSATNRSQFRVWTDQEKVKEYFRGLNIKGPQSDYLILSSVDFIDVIFKNLKQEERAAFLNNLMSGKWDYRVVKEISYDNRPIFSHIIDYTPRYILIFKHVR